MCQRTETLQKRQFLFSFKCQLRTNAKAVFLVCGKRNLIEHIDPLRGAVEKDIIPRFGMFASNMQQQKSH